MYCYGSTTPYLFLTWPNLPSNGVMLDDISRRADQGWFTSVSVDGDNHGKYKWDTASVGDRRDDRAYTVGVANGPTECSRLRSNDYSIISITLKRPGPSVAITGWITADWTQVPVQPVAPATTTTPMSAVTSIPTETSSTPPVPTKATGPG